MSNVKTLLEHLLTGLARGSKNPLDQLRATHEVEKALDACRAEAIDRARRQDLIWSDIGTALGMTGQAAGRWARAHGVAERPSGTGVPNTATPSQSATPIDEPARAEKPATPQHTHPFCDCGDELCTPTPPPPTELEQQVLDIYQRKVRDSGSTWLGMAALRQALPHVAKETLDAELRTMHRSNRWFFIPESNQKALTQDDRAAAYWSGGEWKHLLRPRT